MERRQAEREARIDGEPIPQRGEAYGLEAHKAFYSRDRKRIGGILERLERCGGYAAADSLRWLLESDGRNAHQVLQVCEVALSVPVDLQDAERHLDAIAGK